MEVVDLKQSNLLINKYNHIIPIRCITHHVNLLITDVMKHEYSSTIQKIKKIHIHFKKEKDHSWSHYIFIVYKDLLNIFHIEFIFNINLTDN